jgi:hypothetical protein
MDELLKSQWAADVPASDPRFVLQVMARVERRRFAREMATTLGLGAAGMLLLALAAPALDGAWQASFSPHVSDLVIGLALSGITLALPQFLPAQR